VFSLPFRDGGMSGVKLCTVFVDFCRVFGREVNVRRANPDVVGAVAPVVMQIRLR
jgi:hypothetical protein